jgi:enediyne biosynthesis protein E5
MNTPARGPDRLGGLRRFAIAITVFNILGHTVFGFEQAYAHPFVAVLTAYGVELLLETVSAYSQNRAFKFGGGFRPFVEFLLPAHITGLAVSMLLYSNERLMPLMFTAAVAIGSKYVFRAPVGNGWRHFFNPSNLGISITLVTLDWVGIAAPYQFSENLDGYADWLLPVFIICSGSLINWRFTRRLPLIGGWVGGFIVQATIRSLLFGTPLAAALAPLTGVAFVLFTFYMVTDPATTPHKTSNQIVFGLSVAAMYGLLVAYHLVFAMFFGLTIVCALRGAGLYAQAWLTQRAPESKTVRTVPARALTEI